MDHDLERRCQEILDWKATGFLVKDGALRTYAETLTEVPEHYRLQVAEEMTKTEAMRQVLEQR